MILIHKLLHDIILVDLVRPNENIISYTRYEKNDGIKLFSGNFQVPNNALKSKLNETVNFTDLAYEILSNEFIDFELSNDLQNWKLPTALRLVIPNKLRTQARFEANNLDALFQGIISQNASSETKFLFYSENIAIAYFNEILSEHLPILQPYFDTNEIIIEYKNA